MKKLVFTVVLGMFAFLGASANDLDFGVETKPAMESEWRYGFSVRYENVGAYWLDNGEKQDMSSGSGFSFGGVINYFPITYVGVQTGLDFSILNMESSARAVAGIFDYLVKQDIRFYYLSIPVYAVGKLPVRNVDFLLEIGPQFYCGVGGFIKTEIREYQPDIIHAYEFADMDPYEFFHRFNCMMHFAIGVEYQGARLMVGYNLGVYDIEKLDENEIIRSQGFTISAGYMF